MSNAHELVIELSGRSADVNLVIEDAEQQALGVLWVQNSDVIKYNVKE